MKHRYTFDEAYSKFRKDTPEFWEQHHRDNASHRALISDDWTDPMAKYHYNLVENAIIGALGFEAEGLSVLDVGCGSGWWTRFFYETYHPSRYVGIDISAEIIGRLTDAYEELSPVVSFIRCNISEAEIPPLLGEQRFDVVNAIGVMFHIVDDAGWQTAVHSLGSLLSPRGVMLVGGEFMDHDYEKGVMRKFRSMDTWRKVLDANGLIVTDFVKNEWAHGYNADGIRDNVLVVRKR